MWFGNIQYEQVERASPDKQIQERFYLAEKFIAEIEFRKTVEERTKADYAVKISSISLGGVPAERADSTFICLAHPEVLRRSSDQPESGFYLGGKLNKPEQEAALERIIKSWHWK